MGYKSELKKAERDAIRCVEKLKGSIRDQYGMSFEEWIKMKKEGKDDAKHRENGT